MMAVIGVAPFLAAHKRSVEKENTAVPNEKDRVNTLLSGAIDLLTDTEF